MYITMRSIDSIEPQICFTSPVPNVIYNENEMVIRVLLGARSQNRTGFIMPTKNNKNNKNFSVD